MRFKKILLLPMFVLPSIGFAQYDWDYGLKLGAAGGLTSIGGLTNNPAKPFVLDLVPSQIKWDLGAYVRYKVSKSISLSFNFEWVRLQGFDSLSPYAPRRDRNLNFRDDIFQGSLRCEWTFYHNNDLGGKYTYKNTFNAYLFAGFGIFHMNPEEMFTHTWIDEVHGGVVYKYGDWYRMRDLTTEGEHEYSLIQPSIPMGIGFYYTLNKHIRLGWDIAWNKTFTGYIDDVNGTYPQNGYDVNLPNPYNKYLGSSQSGYVPGITPGELSNYGPGSPRGDYKDDSWISTTINIGYVIKGHRTAFENKGFFQKVNYKSRASF